MASFTARFADTKDIMVTKILSSKGYGWGGFPLFQRIAEVCWINCFAIRNTQMRSTRCSPFLLSFAASASLWFTR